ncbi:MAG TPA: GDSL-type esterase/lipase family protein [Gemmatimonadaceae bacterium]|nr:GDSL-type esterase/lipase family protein [Gemmatimonadaceae bacterium]
MAVFMAVEGGTSLVLFARDVATAFRATPAENINTEYEPELGWTAKRSFTSPNMYGPGIGLTTNQRGFRGKAEVADSVPAGKVRILCSGDSFTLGYGVADDETWCALLARPDVETVNLGQVGYGIDQAYLAYLREARRLEHHVHVFAFVTDDFRRMALDRFLGYAKPYLILNGDSLTVAGVPTARRDNALRAARLRRAVQSLRTAELVARVKDAEASLTGDRIERLSAAEVRAVTALLVNDLARKTAAAQRRLLLVHLPIERDHVNDASRDWREYMRTICDSAGVPFIDLTPALRRLSYPEAQSLYLQSSAAEGMGHFTAKGNQWAAAAVARALDSLAMLPPRAMPTHNGSVSR